MKVQWEDFRWFAYVVFGTGIAALAKSTGMKCFGYDISETGVQTFGAVCLVVGGSWLARTDRK